MKRILRFASVIALSCAALLYTGCAKDYSGDLSDIEKKQQEQDNTLANHETRIAALESAQQTLKSNLETLKSTLEATDAAHAKAIEALQNADQSKAELIAALQNRASVLEAAKEDMKLEIAKIESSIESMQKTIDSQSTTINELKEQLKAHLSDYGELKGKMETYASTLATVQNAVEALENKVDNNYQTLNDKITTVANNFSSLSATVSTILTSVTEIKNQFANYYTKAEIDGKIDVLNKTIDAQGSELKTKIENEVATLQSKDAELKKLIEDNDAKVTSLISALQTKDTELENSLKAEIATRQSEIKALQEDCANIWTNINSLLDSVKQIVIDVDNLEAKVVVLEGVDKALRSSIDSTKAALEAAKIALDNADKENAGKIASLTEMVTKLETLLASLQESVAKIQEDIKTMNTKITELRTNVDKNTTDIAGLLKTVGEINSHLAQVEATVTANKAEFDLFKSDVDSQLDNLWIRASHASDSLVKAFGQIDMLWDYFSNYYDIAYINQLEDILRGEIESGDKAVSDDLKAKYEELKAKDTELKSLIDANAAAIEAEAVLRNSKDVQLADQIEAQRQDLQAKIDNLQSQINTINSAIDVIKSDIFTIQANVSANAAAIAVLQVNVTELKSVDEGLQNQINATNTNLSRIQGELQAAIDANAADIEANAGDIAANAAKIQNLRDSVSILNTLLTSLTEAHNTLAGRVTALESKVSTLESDMATAKLNIDNLNAAVEDLGGTIGATKTVLWARIDSLIAVHKGDISALTSDIDALDTRLTTLRNEFDAQVLKITANTASIAALQTTVGEHTTAIATNAAAIATNATNIAINAANIATNAADIATNAANIATNKGNISANKEAIAALKLQVKADSAAIVTLQSQVSGLITDLSELTTKVATNTSAIAINTENIATNAAAIATNAAAIAELKAKFEEYYSKETVDRLSKKVNELAVRPNSISVLPTTWKEIVTLKIDTVDQNYNHTNLITNDVLVARFEVEPAKALNTMVNDLDNLMVSFKSGLSRSIVEDTTLYLAPVKYAYADTITGAVTVVVNDYNHGVPTKTEPKLYFALTYKGIDDAGEYCITSDYAAAVEETSEFTMCDEFYLSNCADSVVTKNDTVILRDEHDYVQYAANGGMEFKPFSEWKYVHFVPSPTNRTIMLSEPYKTIFNYSEDSKCVTYDNFEDYTGIFFKATTDKVQNIEFKTYSDKAVDQLYNGKLPYSIAGQDRKIREFQSNEANDVLLKFYNKADTLQQYVANSPYEQKFKAYVVSKVNAQRTVSLPTVNKVSAIFDITRVKHYDSKALIKLTMNWNYQQYTSGNRGLVIDTASTVLNEAVKAVTTGKELGLATPTWIKFIQKTDAVDTSFYNGHQVIVSTAPDKYSKPSYKQLLDSIKVSVSGFSMAAYQLDTLKEYYSEDLVHIRRTDSDEYKITINVSADPTCGPQVVSYTHADALVGSVTKSASFTIKNYMRRYLDTDNNGKLDDVFYHGIKGGADSLADAIKAAWATFGSNDFKKEGVDTAAIESITGFSNGDSVVVVLKAGKVLYNNTKNFAVVSDPVFGQKFSTNVTVNVKALPFNLIYREWIVTSDPEMRTGGKGTARMEKKSDGYYDLQTMNYFNQVQVVNIDKSLEESGTAYTVKFRSEDTDTSGTKPALDYSGVTVSSTTGVLGSGAFSWRPYDSTAFNTWAILCVNGIPVDSVNYDVETLRPLKLVSVQNHTYVRQPGKDITIKLDSTAVVYGVVGTEFVTTNICDKNGKFNQGSKPKYYGPVEGGVVADAPKFVYSDPSIEGWNIKINGQKPLQFQENIDYEWDDEANTIKFLGENLNGTLTFEPVVKLQFWLDSGVPETAKLSITVKME